MFVGSGLLSSGIGAAAGLVAAAPLSHLMSALLFQVEPIDPPTYAVVVIGSLAGRCRRPATCRHAASRRIHPVEALRAE